MILRAFEHPFSKSLTIHFLLLAMMLTYFFVSPEIKFQDEPITVSIVDHQKDQKSKNMIVQPSEGEVVKEAKKDSFLSDKTRSVKEERSALKMGSTPRKREVIDQISSQPRAVRLSDLGLKISTKQLVPQENQKHWASNSLGEAVSGGQYMQGLKEGETSALNTKEYVFFSYFERVRRQLDQTWQPMVRGQIEKIYKTGRQLASKTDFITRTLVTINTRGEIVRVQMLEESGTVDLDSAAVSALNKAGPYPNPPKGLLDASGNAQIRWDFVLKT